MKFGRPRTAAMLLNNAGYGSSRPGTGAVPPISKPLGPNSMFDNQANRAISAGFSTNPKLARYEELINRLKKLLDGEKRNLRVIKTMYSLEIEVKN